VLAESVLGEFFLVAIGITPTGGGSYGLVFALAEG
jgi:hypothetical protein